MNLAAILALIKSIPPLASLFEKLIALSEKVSNEYKKAAVAKRHIDKDTAVDASVNNIVHPSEAGSQPKIDEKK